MRTGLYGSPGGNMDNWSQYTGYISEAHIPARKIVAYPFTANAAGQVGQNQVHYQYGPGKRQHVI